MEAGQEAVAGVDEAVVVVHRLGPVDGPPVDGVAEGVEFLDRSEDRAELGLGVGAQCVADVLLLRTRGHALHDPVGDRALRAQDRQRVGGPWVGEEHEGLAALVLDRPDGLLQGVADLLHDGARAEQLACLAPGQIGGEAPECGEGDERHQKQRHDLPADGLSAKAHGLPQLGPAGREWCSVNKRREPTTDTQTTRRHVRTIFGRLTGS